MAGDTPDDDVERDGWPLAGPMNSPPDAPPADDPFALLSDARIRVVVAALSNADGPTASFVDLRRALTAADPACESDPAAARRRAVVALHHVLLPRLDEAGLVDYDARSGTVRYWGDAETEAYLDRLTETAVPADERVDADRGGVGAATEVTGSIDPSLAGDSASLDVWFDLFAHPARRTALATLREAGGRATLAELAVAVAAAETRSEENARDGEDADAEAYRRSYLSLYHEHVPKLAAADVVEYDACADAVRLTTHGEVFERYHDAVVSVDS